MDLTPAARAWEAAGERVPVAGHELHVHERPGVGPALLLLHGFPTSSFDWAPLLEHLRDRRVIAFDALGFGLSDKPREHEYTLAWQADAAQEIVRRAGSPPVWIVAHDMGTSVATELLARDLRGEGTLDIAGVLLFNGSILLHLASPTPGQKLLRSRLGPLFARLNSATSFRLQFGRIFSASHPLARADADDHWSLIAHRDGHRIMDRTIAYMAERERHTERWHGAVRDWPGDLRLAWGLQDPVATVRVLDGLRELRPGVPVRELPGLGHYPQLEDPATFARVIDDCVPPAGATLTP
jgi:pimeloyl-ACP methyl ester carboxylesterase